jgi:hypothetical protein
MKLNQTRLLKVAAGSVLALAFCGAQGDVVIQATVLGTGAGTANSPAAGTYEVDYQTTRARVVRPDGSIVLFDFATSSAAVLNSKSKTYTISPISNLLSNTTTTATSKVSDAVEVVMRASGRRQILLGYTSSGFSLGPVAQAENLGESLFAAVQRGQTPVGPQRFGGQLGLATHTQSVGTLPVSQTIQEFSGAAWLTEAGTNVPSSAPLAFISAPSALAASLASKVDAKGAAPLQTSISYISPTTGKMLNLTMTVTSIELKTLDSSTTQIPSGYTEVN